MSGTTARRSEEDVAWAAGAVGSHVRTARPLTGGWTSTVLRLGHADGRDTVLRVVDRDPWVRHREELTTRERDTMRVLAGSRVPAPRSLALDGPSGRHLMTLLPGAPDPDRVDDGSLRAVAALLASVHDVRPARPPRRYQSWAWEAKYVVPAWAMDPAVWQAAFDLLRGEPPAYEPTFLHRDFQPLNLLWDGDRLAGVVDWVETSTGPAWLDVAHCATSLAQTHGHERAQAFAAAYTALTGRPREPYWEVMDAVGLLPPPGRPAMVTDPGALRRIEARLADSLSRL